MSASMKTSQHNRSNSVPSAPHPLLSQIEENLQRTSSSSSISQKLNGLQDLHGYAIEILQLPTTQRALVQGCCKIWIDELLEGSLRILDICSTSKDSLLQSKESIHELQSAARQKKRSGGETALTNDAAKYLSSRENMKKSIKKALENLKKIKKEAIVLTSSDVDTESLSMISSLKEAEVVTLTILESLLSFVSGLKIQPNKRRSWSMVSMLMQPKRVGCDSEDSNTNEFGKVDEILQSLLSHKAQSGILVEDFLNHMENLELCIEVLEGGIEHLQRQLIRTRVSLLNIPIKY